MFHPAAILGIWLRGLLGFAIVGTAGWLFFQWYEHLPAPPVRNHNLPEDAQVELMNDSPVDRIVHWRPGLDQPTALLAGATLISLLSLGGGAWAYPLLRRQGEDEPSAHRTGRRELLRRPDGTELNVEAYGREDGTPIVFTHGWGVDSTEWYYMKKELASDFRLVLWDLPGMGRSTRAANKDYSVSRLADDLQAVIDWTGSAQVVLVGHSMGGMILQHFARTKDAQKQIAGLVLVHTTYTNPVRTTKGASFYSAIERPILVPLLYLTIGLSPLVWLMNWVAYLNGSVHRSTERQSFSGAETRGQLRFSASFLPRQSPAVLARAMLGMLEFDETKTLPSIDVPAVVVPGEHDPVTLPEASHHLSKTLPRAKQAMLRDGRHQGHMEFHNSFSGILRDFVKSLSLTLRESGGGEKRMPHYRQDGLRLQREGKPAGWS